VKTISSLQPVQYATARPPQAIGNSAPPAARSLPNDQPRGNRSWPRPTAWAVSLFGSLHRNVARFIAPSAKPDFARRNHDRSATPPPRRTNGASRASHGSQHRQLHPRLPASAAASAFRPAGRRIASIIGDVGRAMSKQRAKRKRRAKALARRKAIYLALHPETKHGAMGRRGSGPKARISKNDKLSFSEDTASKTGRSRRSIERDVALGEALDEQAVEPIAHTPVPSGPRPTRHHRP